MVSFNSAGIWTASASPGAKEKNHFIFLYVSIRFDLIKKKLSSPFSVCESVG